MAGSGSILRKRIRRAISTVRIQKTADKSVRTVNNSTSAIKNVRPILIPHIFDYERKTNQYVSTDITIYVLREVRNFLIENATYLSNNRWT